MTTNLETSTRRERSVIYIVSIILLVVLLVGGLIAFRSARESQRAGEKADELIAALEDAGARSAPSRETIIRVLGDDGGAICAADPGSGLVKAILFAQLTNGAAGPGMRPVIADSRVVQGSRLVIQTYCPDKLDEFQQAFDDLDLSDEVAG